jgi:hypothetical protein
MNARHARIPRTQSCTFPPYLAQLEELNIGSHDVSKFLQQSNENLVPKPQRLVASYKPQETLRPGPAHLAAC